MDFLLIWLLFSEVKFDLVPMQIFFKHNLFFLCVVVTNSVLELNGKPKLSFSQLVTLINRTLRGTRRRAIIFLGLQTDVEDDTVARVSDFGSFAIRASEIEDKVKNRILTLEPFVSPLQDTIRNGELSILGYLPLF